jgi:CheY-like chemotaxis protein
MPLTVTLPPIDTAVVVAGMPLVVVVVVDVEDGVVVDVDDPPVVVVEPPSDVVEVVTVDVGRVVVIDDVDEPVAGSDESSGSKVGAVAAISGVEGWSETWSSAAPTTCQAMAVVRPVATIQATISPVRVMWSSSFCFGMAASPVRQGFLKPRDPCRSRPYADAVPRILIVEDDSEIRRLVADSLARLGHDVVSAGSAMEGLQSAVSEAPDLVVLDLGLPDVDGGELLH